jgi:hypothetical protein
VNDDGILEFLAHAGTNFHWLVETLFCKSAAVKHKSALAFSRFNINAHYQLNCLFHAAALQV